MSKEKYLLWKKTISTEYCQIGWKIKFTFDNKKNKF